MTIFITLVVLVFAAAGLAPLLVSSVESDGLVETKEELPLKFVSGM